MAKDAPGRSGLERVVLPVAAGVTLAAGAVDGLLRARRARRAAPEEGAPEADLPVEGEDPPSGLRARLDALGERWPALGVALAVQRRFGELQGNNLAASITLQAFLSLFPLLLVVIAVVGFFSAGGADLAGDVTRELGLTGDAASAVTDAVAAAEESRRAASIVGLVGLLWSGLGLIDALQYGYNQVWQVEGRGFAGKAFGLAWLAGAGVVVAVGGLLTGLLGVLPGPLGVVAVAGALAVNFVLFLWTGRVLPNRDVGWAPLVPGALLGAVGLEALKALGAFYVPRLVASSSQLYGSIGTVFAVLAWLLLVSRLVVYCAVLNVVLYERDRGVDRTTVEVPHVDGQVGPADRMARVPA